MDRWESDGGDVVGFFCLEKTAMLLEKWILMPNFEKCADFSAHKNAN